MQEPIDHRGDFRVIRWEFTNSASKAENGADPDKPPPRASHNTHNTSSQRKRPYQRKANNENRFSYPQLRQDMPFEDGDSDEELWDGGNREMSCRGDADCGNQQVMHSAEHNQFSNSPPAPAGRGRLQELSPDGSVSGSQTRV